MRSMLVTKTAGTNAPRRASMSGGLPLIRRAIKVTPWRGVGNKGVEYTCG